MSPDTNFIFGGSPTGNDICHRQVQQYRQRSTGQPAASTMRSAWMKTPQQYRATGTARIASYYGVFNALPIINNPLTGAAYGATIGHERLLYAGSPPEGVTYTTTYPAGSYNGPANVRPLNPSATTQYTVGANGIRLGLGIGPWLGIEVALPVPAPPQTLSGSVYIDPTGIVNTASSRALHRRHLTRRIRFRPLQRRQYRKLHILRNRRAILRQFSAASRSW